MLTHLDHVLIATDALEASTGILARLLGRRPSWKGEHPAAGTVNALFRLDNTYLELIAPEGKGPAAEALRGRLEQQGPGLLGLAFRTADADACHAVFARAGLAPSAPVAGVGRDVDSGAFREWRTVMLPPARTRGVLLFAIEHRSPEDLLPPAPLLGAEDAAVSGLDHAVVQTADPEATRALYGQALGLRLALDRSFDDWGVRLQFFRIGGVTVEVAARLDGDGAADAPDRLWGLSLRVPDVEASRARLADAGFDVSPVRSGRKPGTRVLTVHGEPLGVATLLLEPAPR